VNTFTVHTQSGNTPRAFIGISGIYPRRRSTRVSRLTHTTKSINYSHRTSRHLDCKRLITRPSTIVQLQRVGLVSYLVSHTALPILYPPLKRPAGLVAFFESL
jgi:hypothetical protein